MDKRTKDLTNQRFGRLYVISITNIRDHASVVWDCRCDCGKKVRVSSRALLSKTPTRSCGCLLIDVKTKHGATSKAGRHPLFEIWVGMNKRCYYTGDKLFDRYGGRGITVCDAWRHNYSAFRDHMLSLPNCPKNAQTPRAKINMTIDRYPNNDGPYEPGNVRWATRKEQMNNTSRNIYVRMPNNTRITLTELIEKQGKVSYDCAWQRIKILGWSVKDAISKPLRDYSP